MKIVASLFAWVVLMLTAAPGLEITHGAPLFQKRLFSSIGACRFGWSASES